MRGTSVPLFFFYAKNTCYFMRNNNYMKGDSMNDIAKILNRIITIVGVLLGLLIILVFVIICILLV